MKKPMIITLLICSLCIGSWQFIQVASAETKSGISAHLVEFGVQEYEEGKVREAIKEFRKALVVDPYNVEAQDYLRQLGVNYTVEPGLRTSIIDGTQFEQHIHIHDQRMAQLEQQKKDMEVALSRVGRETAFINAVHTVPGPVDDSYYTGSFQQYKERLNGPRQSFLIYREEAPDVYAHQDKLIQVYEDYVSLREQQVDQQREALFDRELDVAWAGRLLLDQMDALDGAAQSRNDVMAGIDDEGYMLETKDTYVKYLKERLDLTEADASQFESNLLRAENQISILLNEQQELLSTLKHDVEQLK